MKKLISRVMIAGALLLPASVRSEMGNPILGHWICNRMTNIMTTSQDDWKPGEVRSCAPPKGGEDVTFTPDGYTIIMRSPNGDEQEMPMRVEGYEVSKTASGWRVKVAYFAVLSNDEAPPAYFDISRDRNHLTEEGGPPLKMEYTRDLK